MATHRLLPYGNGSDYLKSMDFSVGTGTELTIGRNVVSAKEDMGTGPNAQYVSRSHLLLTVRNNQIFVKPLAREKGLCYLNGRVLADGAETEMHVGDTVSLLGRLDFFNYVLTDLAPIVVDCDNSPPKQLSKKARLEMEVVELLEDDSQGPQHQDHGITPISTQSRQPSVPSKKVEEVVILDTSSTPEEAPAAAPAPAASSASSGVRAMIASLLQQYECGICFETMACAVSLSPCGDNFCYLCIAEWAAKSTACPCCNSQFDLKRAVPNRVVENSVREVLKLDQEALTAWEERVTQGLDKRKAALANDNNKAKAPTPAAAPPPAPPQPMRFMNHAAQQAQGQQAAAMALLAARLGPAHPQTAGAYFQAAANPFVVDLTDNEHHHPPQHNPQQYHPPARHRNQNRGRGGGRAGRGPFHQYHDY